MNQNAIIPSQSDKGDSYFNSVGCDMSIKLYEQNIQKLIFFKRNIIEKIPFELGTKSLKCH